MTLPQPQPFDPSSRWPSDGSSTARIPVAPGGPYYGPPFPAQGPGVPVQPVYVPPQVTVNVGGGPGRSVTKTRKSTSHGLHLFLTIITGGAWGLCVWLPLVLWHRLGPRRKTVTSHH